MKQSRRIAGSILVGALCFAMAMPAFADSKSDVSSQINSLEGQASELESELASMKANKTSIESYIAELDTKIKGPYLHWIQFLMRLSRQTRRLKRQKRI
ncbi:MAG: hypothetical protein ACLR1V_10810 [Coprococcus sp.]